MADLFKRAPRRPKFIPDEDWILSTPPSEQNSFSPPPRSDSPSFFSSGVIKTIGYESEEWPMEH